MAAQQPARTSPELRARLHSVRANVGITPRPGHYSLCGKHIDKLASDVGHAGHFRGFTFTEHAVETGIAIRMHPALITRQVLDRVLTVELLRRPKIKDFDEKLAPQVLTILFRSIIYPLEGKL